MKSLRVLVLALVVVAVAGLAACTPALPRAIAAMNLSQQQSAPAALAAPPQKASIARTTALAGDLESTLEQIYENNNDVVVNIRVTMDASRALGMQGLPNFGGQLPQIPGLPDFGQLLPNLPGNQDQPGSQDGNNAPSAQALGSGFVWDTDGNIVTNNHVVDGATKISVTFADGTTVPAKLVGHDPDSDLAVIKVDPKGLTLKAISVGDSTTARPGQFTVAIGNPFGLEGTLTFGIVSAVGRSMPANQEGGLLRSNTPSYTIPDIIQTDTPINPGNSGGVLLDLDGKLLGVPTAIESPVGANNGIGFAVPAAIVKNVVPALIGGGKVEHPYLGISGTTLTPELAQAMSLPEMQRGALVSQVVKDGPAEKAGVQASTRQVTIEGQNVKVGGDVITAIDNQPVKRFDDLVTYLARSAQVGKSVTLKVLRDGKETTVNVTVAARPAPSMTASAGNNPGQEQPRGAGPNQQPNANSGAWLGITGLTVTGEVAKAMDLPEDTKGVLVESLAPNGPAVKAGLVASEKDFATSDGQSVKIGGDVITGVDGKAVTSIEQLSRSIGNGKAGQKVVLSILRDGKDQEITATLAARPTQSN